MLIILNATNAQVKGVSMNALRAWCSQPWLYVVYGIGTLNLCIAIFLWNELSTAQVIALLLSAFIAAHVLDENSCPSGFFYMNNLGFGSKRPLVCPQNSLTNMITNLGATVFFRTLAICAPAISVQVATVRCSSTF